MAMAYEHRAARYRHWYAKLLRFYPKPYHERFGEGMEQTFNDLCRERRETGKRLFGFVFWIFADTLVGIIKENVLHIKYFNQYIITILVGLLIVAPFFALEWYTTSGYPRGVPWGVFVILFVAAILFITLLLSVFKDIRENAVRSKWAWFALKVILLLPPALAFTQMVIDQMPCFLGGRGC
jgi:hypothetical protein